VRRPSENGNILACECGTKRLIEIERNTGKEPAAKLKKNKLSR